MLYADRRAVRYTCIFLTLAFVKAVSIEQGVLLQVLRGELTSLPEDLDHEQLFELFRRHKFFTISSTVKDLLEGEEGERWKAQHQQNTLNSLKLSNETAELINHFKNRGIRAIPLKGPVLANSLYGDVGLRHFNDIDLIVVKEQFEETKDALIKIGYSLAYPGPLTAKQERIYSTYKNDVGLHNKERRIFIELHYGIYVHELLKREDESKLLGQTEKITIHNQEIEVLDKESTFIYLVYHGCLHQYFRLFWLRDVAECIKRWELDHDSIINKMKELGLEKMLAISMVLAQYYFKTELPEPYTKFLATCNPQKLINICHNRILGPEKETFKLKIDRHRFLMSLKPGLKYKWTVLWSIFQRWRISKFYGGH